MRLLLFTFALLGLTAIGGHASSNSDSNITFFGAPRASLDGVLPVLSIEEDYIRGQTDGISNGAFGAAGPVQCSVSNPCADGSCCNSQGMCKPNRFIMRFPNTTQVNVASGTSTARTPVSRIAMPRHPVVRTAKMGLRHVH